MGPKLAGVAKKGAGFFNWYGANGAGVGGAWVGVDVAGEL